MSLSCDVTYIMDILFSLGYFHLRFEQITESIGV